MPTYFTHDNGGRPFKVVVNNKINRLQVFKLNKKSGPRDTYQLKPCFKSKFWSIRIGRPKGNSILVEIKPGKYVFIGSVIMQFSTRQPIVSFKSRIGNSDVPYPYASTSSHHLLMLEKVAVPRKDVGRKDAYDYYYGLDKKERKKSITFRSKTLVKRVF